MTTARSTGSRAKAAAPAAAAAQPDVSQRSIGELLGKVTSDLSTLVTQEIALAKAEVTQEAKKAGKMAGAFGGAAGAGYFAVLFGSLTLAFALASLFDSLTLGALVVFLLYAVVAAVLALKGRAQAREINPKPEKTIETLKEDAQWAKNRSS